MSYTATTLWEVEQKIREYLVEQRPLNLDEMRNFADVIASVRVPARRIVDAVPDKQIGWNIKNDWIQMKNNLGHDFQTAFRMKAY